MELWGRNIEGSTTTLPTLASANSAEVSAVLRELVDLLEDYAPIWYTEALHNRVMAALGELQL